ncbi:DUF4349 domain-containing protein [Alkalibaculum bacchi]|uniref:DUF4349 domain-containing protein n=1 Tax=Alkalibaculum bacchi TaxID=645887 RepID=UPI0026EC0043|nr:DUF4349 domain-containing protein [Alkalibaculum bacchi]
MDCKELEGKIDDYIDELLSVEETVGIKRHLEQCEKCQNNYREMKNTVDTIKSIELEKVPENFSQKIIKQIKTRKKGNKMKRFLPYAAVFIVGVLITSLLFKSPLSNAYVSETTSSDEEFAMDSRVVTDFENNQAAGIEMAKESKEDSLTIVKDEVFDIDKIIYQGTLSLDVEDANKAMEGIKDYVKENGGFVESSDNYNGSHTDSELYTSHSYLIIRVPAEKFNKVIDKLKEFGEETSTNISSTNISTEYRDIESEKESLKIQQDRLVDYLKKAEKIEDMLTIETELSRVRTELNRINTQLDHYDRMISYSTITVNLRETGTLATTVKSPFGKLLENISKGFIQSINLLLQVIHFVIVLIARMIPFAIILLPVAWFVRKKWKK